MAGDASPIPPCTHRLQRTGRQTWLAFRGLPIFANLAKKGETAPMKNPRSVAPTLTPVVLSPKARNATGLHLIGDLYGCLCDSRLMHDAQFLEQFCKARVAAADLTSVGSLFHSFGEGGGVTGVVVLAESHLSIHTWPESGYVTLDVYVCNYSTDNRPKAQKLFDDIQAAFNPADPHLHRVERA